MSGPRSGKNPHHQRRPAISLHLATTCGRKPTNRVAPTNVGAAQRQAPPPPAPPRNPLLHLDHTTYLGATNTPTLHTSYNKALSTLPCTAYSPSTPLMQLDEELCLCFHVTKRKVINFIRIEKPVRPGQLAECFGAGTGCGWCRPYLKRLFEAAAAAGQVEPDLPTAADYARQRSRYVRAGGGTPPPGATPIADEPVDSQPEQS